MGLAAPACCCGGPPIPPSPGPPGSISGQILFPPRAQPSALVVYAISTDRIAVFDTRYVMTRVTPPARSYELSVPPGDYIVTARLDSDPLSSAGYLTCAYGSCDPVMSRAGYVTCRTLDCQPVLAPVRVNAGQGVTHIDIGDWGALYALDRVWQLDEFGAPGPLPNVPTPSPGVTPSPADQMPLRQLPVPSTETLTSEFRLSYQYEPSLTPYRIHLPASWHAISNPAREVDASGVRDFASQAVRSPLSLGEDGVWLTAGAQDYGCGPLTTPGETAWSTLGDATFNFEDPHSALGTQPFSGYAFVGAKRVGTGCLLFRFTALSDQSREWRLATFVAIVEQAEYVT